MIAEILGLRADRVEALEHLFAGVFGNSGSVIAHRNSDAFAVIIDQHLDRSFRW